MKPSLEAFDVIKEKLDQVVRGVGELRDEVRQLRKDYMDHSVEMALLKKGDQYQKEQIDLLWEKLRDQRGRQERLMLWVVVLTVALSVGGSAGVVKVLSFFHG